MTATIPDDALDLLDSDTAVLATVGPDGRPQLSAVWFLGEDGTIRVSLNSSRQKVKNLRANPAVTFFVLDPTRPSRYLEVRGDAEIAEDPGYEFADRVGPKYGAEPARLRRPRTEPGRRDHPTGPGQRRRHGGRALSLRPHLAEGPADTLAGAPVDL